MRGVYADYSQCRPAQRRISPGTRDDNDAFFEDVQRGYKQYAFLTSVDFDIVPKVLTITGGSASR
jgi:hypothetical protein